MDQRVVTILGGTGWLGSHLSEMVRISGAEVRTVSRSILDKAGHTRLDLAGASEGRLIEVISGSDVVINCTDAVNIRDGKPRSSDELRVLNIEFPARLVAAAAGCRSAPALIHIGSILEYGPPQGRACRESDLCLPVSNYARSKHDGTRRAVAVAASTELKLRVIRLANLIGPHPAPTTFPGLLTAQLRRAASTGQPAEVTVTEDLRDFLDVRDAVTGIISVINTVETCPPVMNLSSGEPLPVATLLEDLIAVSGVSSRLVDVTFRPLDSMGGALTWADPSLAAEILGWRPQIGLGASLAAMWRSTATRTDGA